ncbi:MAG: potassium transporter Kup, partial [Rhizobiales bacterium 35-66-30]
AMVTTSILFIAQVNRAWGWPKPAVILLGVCLLSLDAAFATSNLTKLHDGGWLPLTIAGIVIFVMVSWRRGLESVVAQQVRFTEPLDGFVARKERASDGVSPRTAIFLSRAGAMTPVALSRMADVMKIRFNRAVVVSVWIVARPRVSPEERVRVTLLDGTFVQVDLRFGYMQQIDVPSVLGPALSARGIDPDEAIYVIGHERIIPPDEIFRLRDVVAHVFAFLARNAERSVDRFGLPRARTMEIGYPVKL